MGTHLGKLIGKRVKGLRERERDPSISQQELADQLTHRGHKVGQAMIGHVEVGAKMPSLPLLIALAKRFDVSTDYLLGLTDNELSIADLEEEARTGGVGGQLGEVISGLEPEARSELLALARRLARTAAVRANEEVEFAWWLTTIEQVAGIAVRQTVERFLLEGDYPGSVVREQ